MKPIHHTFKGTKDSFWNFYFIGDIHLGTISCDEKKLQADIDKIKDDDNAVVFLMGDICECITIKDPRFDSGGLAKWCGWDGKSIINKQAMKAKEYFTPIKKKIFGIIEGNHEEKLGKHNSIDMNDLICDMLETQTLSYSTMIKFMFNKIPFTLVLHHGHGGGRKAGAKVNRIHDMGGDFVFDMIVMGHTHEKGWVPQKPIIMMHQEKVKLNHRERYYGYSGSYLKTCMDNHSGYAERAGYPPVSLGMTKCTLSFYPERMRVITYGGDI